MKIITTHMPKSHKAVFAPSAETIGPFKTEIELVKQLLKKGIDLRQYNYRSNGNERFSFIIWKKK